MGKRAKIILTLSFAAMLLFAGTTFGLAKTGRINFKSLADTVSTVKYVAGVKSVGSGNGFTGKYYQRDASDMNPVFKFQRTDAQIYFDWGQSTPDSRLNADHFSVQWSGQVSPYSSGYYTFYTTTDDGVILSIAGTQYINKWQIQGSTKYYTSQIYLAEGQKYNIVMDYFDSTIDAAAHLTWSGPGFGEQPVPPSQIYSDPNGSTCGSQTCASNQHCKTQGGIEGQPVSYFCVANCTTASCAAEGLVCSAATKECVTAPTTTTNFQLTGIVKKTNGDLIKDATVTVRDAGNTLITSATTTLTTDSYGKNYLTSSFSRTDLSNLTATFSASGYSSVPLKLTDPGAITGLRSSGLSEVDTVKDVTLLSSTAVQTENFDMKGIVTDENSKPLKGVTISVGCTGPTPSADCLAKVPAFKNGASQATVTDNHNYYLADIYNIRNSTIPKLEIILIMGDQYGKYYYDTNNDDVMQESEKGMSILYLSPDEIRSGTSDVKSSVLRDFKLKPVPPPTIKIYGTVKDWRNNMIPNVTVTVSTNGTTFMPSWYDNTRVDSLKGQNRITDDYNYIVSNITKPISSQNFYIKLSGVPAGYYLDENGDYLDDGPIPVTISENGELFVRNFTLSSPEDSPVRISGNVYDKANNKPLKGALIKLIKSSTGTQINTDCVTTNEVGAYSVSVKIPENGAYKVKAYLTDYQVDINSEKSVSLLNGQIYTGINLSLIKCSINSPPGSCSKSDDFGEVSCVGPSSSSCKCTCNVKTSTYNFFGKEIIVNSNPAMTLALDSVKSELSAAFTAGTIYTYNFWDSKCGKNDGPAFSCRGIKNPNVSQCVPSNHAKGLAVDFNVGCNPQLSSRPSSGCPNNYPPAVVAVFKKFGFRWGGDYKHSCDAMHFEYMGNK